MPEEATTSPPAERPSGDTRLAILLAMATFVLVVETSLMNVSISAVVHGSPRMYRRRSSASTRMQTARAQVALIIPLLAGVIGPLNGFRMTRLPDPEPSGSVEGMSLG
jgi:hypothetical protein